MIGIPAYAACFFSFAHRAFCASAILLRPAADMVRFFTSVCFGLLLDPGGLPRLRGLLVPAKSARACCSRAISSSMFRSRAVSSIWPIYNNPSHCGVTVVLPWRACGGIHKCIQPHPSRSLRRTAWSTPGTIRGLLPVCRRWVSTRVHDAHHLGHLPPDPFNSQGE